jgi:hypothetical protein
MTPVRELRLPSEESLREFVLAQRWFGSKSREVAHFRLLETIPLTEQPLGLAVLEVEFLPGTHELYQLPIGARPEGEWTEGIICTNEGMAIYDAMTDTDMVRQLVRLIAGNTDIETAQGVAEFRALGDGLGGKVETVRPMGAEQSNSSVVLDERLVSWRSCASSPSATSRTSPRCGAGTRTRAGSSTRPSASSRSSSPAPPTAGTSRWPTCARTRRGSWSAPGCWARSPAGCTPSWARRTPTRPSRPKRPRPRPWAC